MCIYEAILQTTPKQPYIRRTSWEYPTLAPTNAPVKILPTNSPAGFVVVFAENAMSRYGWSPIRDDLAANDWEPVGL